MATDPTALIQQLVNAGGNFAQSFQGGQQQALQTAGAQQQLQAGALQLAAVQQKAQQAQQYQQDVEGYFKDPSPQNLANLAVKYPQQAEGLKQSYSIMAAPQKESRIAVLGGIYEAAKRGNSALVASQMDSVIQAEKNAGIDTSDAESLKASIADGDKDALTRAQAFAQMHLAAADPDFAKAVGITGGDKDATHVINPGGALVDNTGKELYRASEAPKYEKMANADGSETLVQVGGGPVQTNPAGAAAPGAQGQPLSTRLNNPGAIRFDPKNQWNGQVGQEGGFVKFATPEAGARAHSILISNQIKNGFDTPATWAAHYAPASDGNDPVKYAQTIASGLGIGVNDKIPLSAVPKVARLSSEVEAGGSPSPASQPTAQAPGTKVLFTSKPAASEVDDATVNFYAQKVAAGGDLPTLGMGKQAAALRQAILAKSAQIQTGQGLSGADSNLLHADVKSAGMALTALQKTRNSLDPFLQTFDGASEQVRKLAPMGVAGGVPLFNKWKQATRDQIAGNPQLAKFDVALAAVANENAKIMSGASGGAVTSDSARAEAHALINRAQSLPQLMGALDQMKTDTQIRLKSLDDRQAKLRAQISGKGSNVAPSSAGVPAPSLPTQPATAAPVQVSTRAQAMALPPGTKFLDPNGVLRTRP